MKLKDIPKPASLLKQNSKIAELIRFGIVGGLATLIQYGLYVVFVRITKIEPTWATILSYLISLVINFILTSHFTFRSAPNAKKGLGFICSHVINMLMQTGLVFIFKGIVGPTLALLPAMAICVPCNFLLVRFAFKGRWFQNKEEKLIV